MFELILNELIDLNMNQRDLSDIIQCLVPLIQNEAEKLIEKEKRKRRNGRVWVKPWIAKRQKLGASATLLKELADEDPTSYRNVLRLDGKQFDTLLELVSPKIQKKNTHMRDAIPARLKLEATLRYLATGDSFASLKYLFRLPPCTTSNFLPEVLSAMYEALQEYIKVSVKYFIYITRIKYKRKNKKRTLRSVKSYQSAKF